MEISACPPGHFSIPLLVSILFHRMMGELELTVYVTMSYHWVWFLSSICKVYTSSLIVMPYRLLWSSVPNHARWQLYEVNIRSQMRGRFCLNVAPGWRARINNWNDDLKTIWKSSGQHNMKLVAWTGPTTPKKVLSQLNVETSLRQHEHHWFTL